MPQPEGSNNAKRAAWYMWLLAGFLGVFFGCCSAFFSLLTAIPYEELTKQEGFSELDPQMHEQFQQVYQLSGPIAVLFFVIACIPAIVFAILAFWVRKINTTAMLISKILLIIQLLLFGLILVQSIVQGVTMGNFPAVFVVLFIIGIPVGLQITVLYYLNQAKYDSADHDQHDWNKPQPWE